MIRPSGGQPPAGPPPPFRRILYVSVTIIMVCLTVGQQQQQLDTQLRQGQGLAVYFISLNDSRFWQFLNPVWDRVAEAYGVGAQDGSRATVCHHGSQGLHGGPHIC
jgi:hypothetical protein